jgi:hypothetical protein
MANYKIEEIEGIGEKMGAKLREASVRILIFISVRSEQLLTPDGIEKTE